MTLGIWCKASDSSQGVSTSNLGLLAPAVQAVGGINSGCTCLIQFLSHLRRLEKIHEKSSYPSIKFNMYEDFTQSILLSGIKAIVRISTCSMCYLLHYKAFPVLNHCVFKAALALSRLLRCIARASTLAFSYL